MTRHKYDPATPLSHADRVAIVDAMFAAQFKPGWLTFRAPPNKTDGMVALPWQMGRTVNYIFHEGGSYIQFPSVRHRDVYVRELKGYLVNDEHGPPEESVGADEIANIKLFIKLAEAARPWERGHLTHGRYTQGG